MKYKKVHFFWCFYIYRYFIGLYGVIVHHLKLFYTFQLLQIRYTNGIKANEKKISIECNLHCIVIAINIYMLYYYGKLQLFLLLLLTYNYNYSFIQVEYEFLLLYFEFQSALFFQKHFSIMHLILHVHLAKNLTTSKRIVKNNEGKCVSL
jgi:hypothetical protein